jgi:hypothetical protein
MGNVLLQTPVAIFGVQPYFTTGAGLYRETLGTHQDTSFGFNTGGGAKITLIGPAAAASGLSGVQTRKRLRCTRPRTASTWD